MDHVIPVVTGTAVGAIYLGSALKVPVAGRTLIGLTMLAGALFNAIWTYPNRDWALESMVEGAAIPFYIDFTRVFVVPNTAAFVALVVTFETGAGLLAMGRGAWVKAAMAGVAFWFATMWAMAPADGLVATALAHAGAAAAAVILTRRDQAQSIPEMVIRRVRGHGRQFRSVEP